MVYRAKLERISQLQEEASDLKAMMVRTFFDDCSHM